MHVIRRSPEQFGYQRSRWTLAMLRAVCTWLRVTTDSGMCQLLKRLHIRYKRGRDYIHSPDPAYAHKVEQIQACRHQVQSQTHSVLLYLDQMSYSRQPSLARAYAAQGHVQALAYRSYRPNTQRRIVATLDAQTGRVLYRQWSHISRFRLVDFYAAVATAYASVETIYLVLDNWPVHFHADTLACLQPQRRLITPPHLPDNWPTQPTVPPRYQDLPIQLLCLPTYASWLNPIEKLWRWLRQDVLHLHRHSDDWAGLQARVSDFLDQFQAGSEPLLRYTGLLPP